MMRSILVGSLLVGLVGHSLAAQEPESPGSVEKMIQKLEEELAELRRSHDEKLRLLDEERRKDRESLLDEIDALEERLSTPPATGSPLVQRLNVFNPSITVFGNFLGRFDDEKVFNDRGDRVDDRFALREVEIDFRAAIDPWADGVIIASYEAETPGDYQATIEEGYVVLKRLPVLDSSPLGLKLEVGRFRPDFGRTNRIHLHDLPFPTYPPAFRTFLGEEGFSQDGVSGQFFLPTPGEDNTLEATLQWINGGDLPVAAGNASNDPALVGRLGWFFDLGEGHDLELGTSIYQGRFNRGGGLDTALYGLDFLYRWRPYQAGQWSSFLLGGELYSAAIEQEQGADSTPRGGFVHSQLQLDKNLYVGGRYDYAQELENDHLATQTAGAYVTYYTTEFLRFRLGYERVFQSDLARNEDLDTLFFELNFIFGSHPVEPYWVNR